MNAIEITNKTIKIEAHTFATRNIGSVSIESDQAPKWPWIILVPCALILFGLIIGYSKNGGSIGAIALFLCASGYFAYLIFGHTPTYTLIIFAGGGEVKTISSKDRKELEKLKISIELAIAEEVA